MRRILIVPVVVLAVVSTIAWSASPPAEGVATEDSESAARLLLGGEAERAAAIYKSLLDSRPEDDASRVGRVHALLALDRWREALREAREYAARRPESAEVRAVLGEALFRAGRLEEADGLLSPFRDEDTPRALMVLGRLRSAQGRNDEAIAFLNRALELAPDDRDVVYRAVGASADRAETLRRLNRYLSLSEGDDPDRIEAARGKVRLYTALGKRPVWVRENRPDRAELRLQPLGAGLGDVVGYVIEGKFAEGRPVPLLLDTGSTGLFLLHRIARKRSFEPLAEETAFGGGGDKRHSSPSGLFPSFSVGELRFADALAMTTTTEIEPTGRYHGLVGLDVFQGYRVAMDLKRNRLSLDSSPAVESVAGEPYWEIGGQILVRARTSGGTEGLFLLDTGATRSMVSFSLLEEGGKGRVGEATEVRGYGGKFEQARVIRGVHLRYQGKRTPGNALTAVDLSVRSRLAGIEVSGFLGLDVLGGRRVVVDTVARRVRIEESEPGGRRSKKKKRK